ncbi:GNAT family N-acetyltransferase [Pontibaca salina]|uniref:GNAT family N-acetyltransferase n=1 Tax=Pontibaca salina TaxID=2795731 RepID=A0A934LZ70_9RHOB|nr:GNAT family N-acetyltransferase [Pontibaca salina]MBI6628690.1 GNAT family N-acetyltransferase [Pontibaca salina]
MAAIHAATFIDSRSWSAAEFAGLLDTPGCFVCGDETAFALVRVTLDEAELLTIATHPEYRRIGLGRALMNVWHTRAVQLGARRAYLEVAADNVPALTLYSACGYTIAGHRRRYYARPDGGTPVDATVMTRPLP